MPPAFAEIPAIPVPIGASGAFQPNAVITVEGASGQLSGAATKELLDRISGVLTHGLHKRTAEPQCFSEFQRRSLGSENRQQKSRYSDKQVFLHLKNGLAKPSLIAFITIRSDSVTREGGGVMI